MPRRNSLVVSAWRRERLRRTVMSHSPWAVSWPISPEPTSPGQPSPRVEIHSADSTRRPQTGKIRSPAPAPAANPTIVRPSLASALTAPSNRTNRMLKKNGVGSLDGPFRSQSAHDQNVLPRCARFGTNPGHPLESASCTAAALPDSIFEHHAEVFSCCPRYAGHVNFHCATIFYPRTPS